MNTVNIVGRISQEIKTAQSKEGNAIANISIAVPKITNYKEADFFKCTAFGKTAELISQYMKKGSRIGITGHLTVNKFKTKTGYDVESTEIIIDQVEFLENKERG